MKWIFSIIILLISSVSFGQGFSYSYVDPCSKKTNTVYIPTGQNSVTVSYYGVVNTFTQADFQNGTFNAWMYTVSSASSQPCQGLKTETQTKTNNLITSNIISTLTSVTAASTMAVTSTIGSVGSQTAGNALGNSVNNSSDNSGGGDNKENKNGKSNTDNQSSNSSSGNVQNSSTTTNGGTNTGGNTNNNQPTSGGNNQSGETNSQNGGGTPNSTNTSQNGSGQAQPTVNNSPKTEGSSPKTETNTTQSGSNTPKTQTNSNSNSPKTDGNSPKTETNTNNSGGNTGNSGSGTNTTDNNSGGNTNNSGGNTNNSGTTNSGSGVGNNPDNKTNTNDPTTTSKTGGNGGTTNSVANAAEASSGGSGGSGSSSKGGAKSNTKVGSVIGTGDIVAIRSAEDGANSFKATMSVTKSNTNNTRAKGALLNFTTAINNSNLTLYGAFTNKKMSNTLICANSTMVNFNYDLFNTTTILESHRWNKLSLMGGLNYTIGSMAETSFSNLSAVGGGFYMFKVNKKLSGNMLLLAVYSPFTKFYEGSWWSSGTLLVPFSSWDYTISKNFKYNISFSGTWEVNKSVLQYQILTGGKILL